MTKAVLVSAQFLVQLPEDTDYRQAEEYGVDWLSGIVHQSTEGCLDYRHPKIAGVYLRPVPVQIKDMDADDIFEDDNLMQL